MYDNTLMPLLPEPYEGLETVVVTPNGSCFPGLADYVTCEGGESFSVCRCGAVADA